MYSKENTGDTGLRALHIARCEIWPLDGASDPSICNWTALTSALLFWKFNHFIILSQLLLVYFIKHLIHQFYSHIERFWCICPQDLKWNRENISFLFQFIRISHWSPLKVCLRQMTAFFFFFPFGTNTRFRWWKQIFIKKYTQWFLCFLVFTILKDSRFVASNE